MPKIDPAAAPVAQGCDYPAEYEAPFRDRVRRKLGDAAGLTQFGVNVTELAPGGLSSLRHWHEREDEMVFVLEGTLTLVDAHGETPLGPGEAAGFPGGDANAHHFVNRGATTARYLEIGTRPPRDRCHYGDVDLVCVDHDGATWFERRDGTRLP
jgi:uncharacterized cupin superfamily protein